MHMDVSSEPYDARVTEKMVRPRTATPVLCELAQSNCTWTCHKSHFMWKFTRNMPDANPAALVSCQPAQSKCTWTCQKSHLVWKFTGNLPYALTTTPSSCEAVQSKCTLHFTRAILFENLQGKCQTLIPRRPFCASLRSRNAHGHVIRAI